MHETIATQRSLDLRGKTITTYLLYEIHAALAGIGEGERVEAVTDPCPAIDSDLRAWCRTTGNPLIDVVADGQTRRFIIEKGTPRESAHKLAAIVSGDGLFELLSPLGFALAAALEGHEVVLYFQGPAVRVLGKGFTAKMHGPGRPFSRFPRAGLAKIGHLPPEEKIAQLQELGGRLYACGPSMDHYPRWTTTRSTRPTSPSPASPSPPTPPSWSKWTAPISTSSSSARRAPWPRRRGCTR